MDADTQPTRAAKPMRAQTRDRPTGPSRQTAGSTALTPVTALRKDSASHLRLMSWAGVVVTVLGAVFPHISSRGTYGTRLLFTLSCGALLAVFCAALWLTREGRDPPRLLAPVIGQTACLASIGLLAFWGIYSPAIAIYVLGMSIYANVVDRGFAILGYATLAAIHAGMWLLFTSGAIDDPGIVKGDDLLMKDKVMGMLLTQLFLFVSFVWARVSRRATLDSMAELDVAVRSVAVRDALLNEARLDLERARGGPGLFSGQEVGSYVLGEVIGRGAMGEIYAASHLESGQPAAVKLLHRHLLGEPDHVERFMREVEIAASLDVDNVVEVYEHSEVGSPIPYLAMERLEGTDLSSLLRRRGRLVARRTVELVTGVSRGLDAAHDAGIIHRDLKPANLFLSRSGDRPTWKILDFGVSKLATSSGTLTQGGVLGTPGYMAPEQLAGEEVDARADIFALAVIAYRCVTSRPAFVGDQPAVMNQTLSAMPPRPSSLGTVSEDVDSVLRIGLAKRPDDRFERAGEFARAFSRAVDGNLSPELRARAARLDADLPWS